MGKRQSKRSTFAALSVVLACLLGTGWIVLELSGLHVGSGMQNHASRLANTALAVTTAIVGPAGYAFGIVGLLGFERRSLALPGMAMNAVASIGILFRLFT